MFNLLKKSLVIISISLIFGCATIPTDFQEPAFSIMDIEIRNTAGLSPEFEIILRVTNPNRVPLEIVGMSYDISMEGNKVVIGVANDLPDIGPYDEAVVTVIAQINLMGSISLLRDLARRNTDSVSYDFTARMDIGQTYPVITIAETGKIRL
jgi:LEA14-like dessication related protein